MGLPHTASGWNFQALCKAGAKKPGLAGRTPPASGLPAPYTEPEHIKMKPRTHVNMC